MSQEIMPAWLKSKNQFGQEVKVSPLTKGRDVLIENKTNLEDEVDDIYEAIKTIELTPGPQGPQGLRGEKGAKGVIVSETEPEDPEIDLWISPQFDIDHIINLNDYYKKGEIDTMFQGVDNRLIPVELQLDELLNPLTINSFSCTPSQVELGTIQPSLKLSWSYSREPLRQTLDGSELEASLTGQEVIGPFEGNQSFKLVASSYSKNVSSTVTFKVMNSVYFGVYSATTNLNQLLPNLSKELRDTRKKSFTVNAGANQYIYYAYPTRYGQATFSVGGFEGGFDLILTSEVTNSSGYIEPYYVYRSTNQNLGNTTVNVE